jgi:hypothetical protein
MTSETKVLAALDELCTYAADRFPLATFAREGHPGSVRQRLAELIDLLRLLGDAEIVGLGQALYDLCHMRHQTGNYDLRRRKLDEIRRDREPVVLVVADWHRDQHEGKDPPWLSELTVQPWQAVGSHRPQHGRWSRKLAPIVQRVVEENAGKPRKEVRAALRQAWDDAGMGPRKYFPYKVWCRLVREALGHRERVAGPLFD